MSGLQTFKKGHIWRVGNGRSINIWKDHWVPGMMSRKIETPRGNVLLRTVDELIDPLTGQWDIDILESIFNPLEVRRVLQIPISPNLEDDFISWHKTKSFNFSVRSAYYLEWEHQHGRSGRRYDGEGPARRNPVWDILWKLQVPAKVKIFIWRSLHGLVPGMCLLANRHIKVAAQCPICQQGAEDIRHLIFTCKRAKEVWKALGLDDFLKQFMATDRSGSVILEEILRSQVKKSPIIGHLGFQETVAVAAWYIWWQRREAVKGESVVPPARSAFSIQALTSNFGLAEKKAAPKEVSWTRPPHRQYKLNVDATYFPSGVGAVAAVVRNDRGESIAGGAKPVENVLDAATAEAMALRHGLNILEGIGCSPVIVESDSLELINACNGVIELWSPYTAILADCFQISQRIGNISFKHCPREANKTAHNLARLSFDCSSVFMWDGDPPSSVLSDVINDVSLLSNE